MSIVCVSHVGIGLSDFGVGLRPSVMLAEMGIYCDNLSAKIFYRLL